MPGLLKPYHRRFDCTAQSTTVRRTTSPSDNRLLVTSHDELGAALVLAGRRIRHLKIGRRNDTVLRLLLLLLPDSSIGTRIANTSQAL